MPWLRAIVVNQPTARDGKFLPRTTKTGKGIHTDSRPGLLSDQGQEICPEGKDDDFNVASQFENEITEDVVDADLRLLADAPKACNMLLWKSSLEILAKLL